MCVCVGGGGVPLGKGRRQELSGEASAGAPHTRPPPPGHSPLALPAPPCPPPRLIDLLNAFESFSVAARSARGDMDTASSNGASSSSSAAHERSGGEASSSNGAHGGSLAAGGGNGSRNGRASPFPLPFTAFAGISPDIGLFGLPANRFDLRQQRTLDSDGRLRDSLRFVFAPEGAFFR